MEIMLQLNMIFLYLSTAALLLAVFLSHTLFRRFRAHSIKHLPGPPPGSWLVGMPSHCRLFFSLTHRIITRQYAGIIATKGDRRRRLCMDTEIWHRREHHGTIWCQCILYYHDDVGGRSTQCLLYRRGKRYSLQILK